MNRSLSVAFSWKTYILAHELSECLFVVFLPFLCQDHTIFGFCSISIGVIAIKLTTEFTSCFIVKNSCRFCRHLLSNVRRSDGFGCCELFQDAADGSPVRFLWFFIVEISDIRVNWHD